MSLKKLQLQIPEHQHRGHFVKAKVRVHRHPDSAPAIFHGRGADYDAQGCLFVQQPQAAVQVRRRESEKEKIKSEQLMCCIIGQIYLMRAYFKLSILSSCNRWLQAIPA